MRTSLIPSAVRAACYNLNRKNNAGRLFEFAKVYNPKELPLTELPAENQVLSFVTFGENEDFFTAKGVVEGILDNFCNGLDVEYKVSQKGFLHPTRSADVFVSGVYVGYLGQIHPSITEKLDIDKPVYGGEISYDALKSCFNDKIMVKQISKYPTVERDIAVLLDANVSCGDVLKAIKRSGGEFLSEVSLFDVYQGAQIGENKKSMAFNLIFVSYDRTLNVDEIDQTIKEILSVLEKDLGAELR